MLVVYRSSKGGHNYCGTQKRLRQGLNNMGLWKHGVEQILAVAGMQNKQTERKTLARQISNKGALCAAHAEKQKKGQTFNRLMRRVRERVTENNYSSNGPFQGLLSAKRRVKEITSRRRCDLL